MSKGKTSGGHPDPDVQKLYRTLRNSVELTANLHGKVPPNTYEILRASCLGMMEVYATITDKPSPISRILDDWEGRLEGVLS